MSTQRRLELASQQQEDHQSDVSLMDKASWHRALEAETEAAQDDNSPLSVIFIDVNYFKDINDTLGHDVGDHVIAKVRHILEENLRVSEKRLGKDRDLITVSESQPLEDLNDIHDIDYKAGHIGGDEFAVICKADDRGAKIITERVRDAFDKYLADPSNSELAKLGISLAIGVSVLQPEMTSAELLRHADEDMYADKMRQLPPLSDEQVKVILELQAKLEKHNIRYRDIGKYLLMLSEVSKP